MGSSPSLNIFELKKIILGEHFICGVKQTDRQTDKQTDKQTNKYPKVIWFSENKPLGPAMPGPAATRAKLIIF